MNFIINVLIDMINREHLILRGKFSCFLNLLKCSGGGGCKFLSFFFFSKMTDNFRDSRLRCRFVGKGMHTKLIEFQRLWLISRYLRSQYFKQTTLLSGSKYEDSKTICMQKNLFRSSNYSIIFSDYVYRFACNLYVSNIRSLFYAIIFFS